MTQALGKPPGVGDRKRPLTSITSAKSESHTRAISNENRVVFMEGSSLFLDRRFQLPSRGAARTTLAGEVWRNKWQTGQGKPAEVSWDLIAGDSTGKHSDSVHRLVGLATDLAGFQSLPTLFESRCHPAKFSTVWEQPQSKSLTSGGTPCLPTSKSPGAGCSSSRPPAHRARSPRLCFGNQRTVRTFWPTAVQPRTLGSKGRF